MIAKNGYYMTVGELKRKLDEIPDTFGIEVNVRVPGECKELPEVVGLCLGTHGTDFGTVVLTITGVTGIQT